MLWILGTAFAARYLYAGLSASGNTKQKYIDSKYERAARKVLGKHAVLKRWGPLILLGVFLVVSQNILSVIDYLPPAGAVLAVLIISALIFIYTIDVEIKIAKQIADEKGTEESVENKSSRGIFLSPLTPHSMPFGTTRFNLVSKYVSFADSA